jgi:hypothetical protein
MEPNISIINKPTKKLPAGAVVESKETSIRIEEIDNGFITIKSISYKYSLPGKDYNDWKTIDTKVYSENNPLKNIKIESSGDKDVDSSLADIFTI